MAKMIWAAAAVAALGAFAAGPAAAQGRGDPAAMLQRADADGDGLVTRAEILALRGAMFERMDRNGDGQLAGDELRRGGGARMDANGDGVVTRDEATGGELRVMQFDANGDDALDAAEIQALRDASANRRGQRANP